MNEPSENLFHPEGPLYRFLYLVLFAVIFWLCEFILIALAIFQFLHWVICGEKNDKVTEFAKQFSSYIGEISAYLTLASDTRPFPFQDWEVGSSGADASRAGDSPAAATQSSAPARKKSAGKKATAKKTGKKKTRSSVKKKTSG